jgi:uncharacterized protein (DUF111 family)
VKTLYIEAFAGISGNMLLGALLDLGFPLAVLEQEVAKLHLGAYRLILEQVTISAGLPLRTLTCSCQSRT